MDIVQMHMVHVINKDIFKPAAYSSCVNLLKRRFIKTCMIILNIIYRLWFWQLFYFNWDLINININLKSILIELTLVVTHKSRRYVMPIYIFTWLKREYFYVIQMDSLFTFENMMISLIRIIVVYSYLWKLNHIKFAPC